MLASFLLVALLLGACRGDDAPEAGRDTTTTSDTSVTTTTPVDSTPTKTTSTTSTVPPLEVPVDSPADIVWVHLFDDTLKTPAGVETLLDEVDAAGIDAVFAQVARRHDAYFDSEYLPPTPDPGLTPGFDVLEALIEGAHERGIQLHAWFVIAPVYHHQYDGLTMPAGHIWLDHGPDSDDSWMTVSSDGTRSRDYLDVALPAVHEHVESIITDIAGRYAVDGIHLDYARYDGQEWGYHPAALEQFSLDTGRADHPAPDDPQWSAWRTSRTAVLVERAAGALDAARPGALLSAAVIAGGPGPSASEGGFAGTRAAQEYFQDWPSWLDEGHVDLLLGMAYTREHNAEHAGWFRQWVSFAGELAERHPGRIGIGVGAYLNSVDDALAQIELVREVTGHVGVYSYQQDSSETPRGEVLARCCSE